MIISVNKLTHVRHICHPDLAVWEYLAFIVFPKRNMAENVNDDDEILTDDGRYWNGFETQSLRQNDSGASVRTMHELPAGYPSPPPNSADELPSR